MIDRAEELTRGMLTQPFQTLPLSHAQRALWSIHQLAPTTTAYHVAFTARVHGAVDPAALRQAFQLLVDRHASLRTSITTIQHEPVQVIHDQQVVDFRLLSTAASNDEALMAEVTAAYAQPFDFAQGPLFRVRLFACAASADHVLLINAHHLICDGLSMCVLLDELRVLYPALLQGTSPTLPPLRASYTDFVAWQHEQVAQKGDQFAAYWQERLAHAPGLLQLPTDYSRPPIYAYRGASQPFQLSAQVTQQLVALAAMVGVTLTTLLTAALQVLLYRYSGQETIIVGVAAANRAQPTFKVVVGYLTNVLVLRSDLAPAQSFLDLLQQVKANLFAALLRQSYPFSEVVARLPIARDPSYPPLVQVSVGLLPLPQGLEGFYTRQTAGLAQDQVDFAGLRLSPFAIPQQEGQCDLTVELENDGRQLSGNFKFNPDIFDAATIERMAGHFQVLLGGIVADPAQPISQLSLLSEAERQQILVDWNATTTAYPHDQCIHQLFEAQVERTPQAPAVCFGDTTLSYGELNRRANQLAHQLRALGVGPDTLVGLCVERSVAMVVGLLAILKAGGAYLPLDPTYPAERLAFMLQDAAVPLLLTQSHLRAQLPPPSAQVLELDEELPDLWPDHNPVSAVQPDHLAYCIYTSGSTGQPKGVLLTHRGLVNSTCEQMRLYEVTPASRVAQAVSFSFDVATADIFMTLCSGACLVLLPPLQQLGADLSSALRAAAITHVQLPTPVLTALPPMELSALETIVVGGDIVSSDLVEHWGRGWRFLNAYGPTETTIVTTVAQCPASHVQPPIGRPIGNTQVYVLDSREQPVPIKVPGELYIGGVGVARGYLNRLELTAERFVANPFGPGRLYRTGDLVHWRPDGNLEFLGRLDHQVKLRGFRIELGEIESRLRAHPAIREVVVLAREDQQGEKRLVAYLLGEGAPADTLRDYLRLTLPEYMLPAAFVWLEALPLTSNGKLDRQALPAPDYADAQAVYTAPRTETERALAAIWQEVLKLTRVGVHENFFALGGHSLLATQVIGRLNHMMPVQLPLRVLFEYPTISALAAVIDEHTLQQPDQHAGTAEQVVLQPVPRDRPLPLSFYQEDAYLLSQSTTEATAFRVNNSYLYRLVGNLDLPALERSVNALIERHEILRTMYLPVGGELAATLPAPVVQSVVPYAAIVPVLVDLCAMSQAKQAAAIERLTEQEATTLLDFTQAPALRVTLVQLGHNEHLLLLTIHHIGFDGWSTGILLAELSAYYRAFVTREQASLPPLPLQYGDFATWQRRFYTPAVLVERQRYWEELLAAPPPRLRFRLARPQPADTGALTFKAGSEPLRLSPELTCQLKLVGQRRQASLPMLLLTAYATVLYRHSGCDDLLVGAPTNNRNQPGLTTLIGHFSALSLLRIDLRGSPTLEEALARVKETLVLALSNQDVTLRQLLRLAPEGWLPSGLPAVQATFNYLPSAEQDAIDLPGLKLEPVPLAKTEIPRALTFLSSETVLPTGEVSLEGEWIYREDLFSAATIRQMQHDLQLVLQALVDDAQQPIDQLPLSLDR